MDDVILNKKRLLLHACCAPCSTYPLLKLNDIYDISIYYSNSNLISLAEFNKRLNNFSILKQKFNFNLFVDDYNAYSWNQLTKNNKLDPEKGPRCEICIKYRLERTFLFAKTNKIDIVSSTLTCAPYKNSEMIFEIARKLIFEYGVDFLFENFKKNDGFKKSMIFSRQNDLYLQDFCGCVYSVHDKNIKQRKV